MINVNSNFESNSQRRMTKTPWPEPLKAYVGRAFENIQDEDRPRVEAYLKEMVTLAFEAGSVWTTDWTTEPLPNLKRKTRFAVDDSLEQRQKRLKRFEDLTIKAPPPIQYLPEGVPDHDEHTIVGHATKLEKSYLRLTSAPDPSTVRPLPILRQTLELLKEKWKNEANYAYICDQFKSLRQDLTVQRIKNEFTIRVYEIHARIALEKADLGEYNQCQTQLQSLYVLLPGEGKPLEFLAYRILYMLHTRNLSEINTLLVNMTREQRANEAVSHALSVRKAMACSNYIRLFKLYLEAPNMSGYLMANFIERERIAALTTISKSCRPKYPIDEETSRMLGFEDRHMFADFLTSLGIPIEEDSIDTKSCQDIFERCRVSVVDIKGQIS